MFKIEQRKKGTETETGLEGIAKTRQEMIVAWSRVMAVELEKRCQILAVLRTVERIC